MSGQKKSVDEIWKELNARPAGRSGTLGTALGGAPNLPGITSISRLVPSRPGGADGQQAHAAVPGGPMQPGGAKAAAPAGTSHAPMDIAIGSAADARRPTSHYDPARAGVSAEAMQAMLSSIQRSINCLSDPDRSVRKQAIASLSTRLTKGGGGAPAPDLPMLQALICGPLLYPVVTLLADPGEAARLAAAELLQHAAQAVPDFSPALPVLMPEVLRRMGHLPVVEPAEEVRLLLTGLVAAIVQRSTPATLQSYAGDFCLFLFRALEDGFHEIKKAAAGVTCALASTAAPESVEPHADKLLQALMPNLQHQHSRVRLATIEALSALVSHGCVPAGLVQSSAPLLRPVAYDRAPAVREALFVAVAKWLGYCPPAAGGPEEVGAAGGGVSLVQSPESAACLLPLLLVGVSDAQPSLAQQALALVEGVGRAWVGIGGGDEGVVAAAAAAPAPPDIGEAMQGIEGAASEVESMEVSSTSSAAEGLAAQGGSDAEAAVAACQLPAPYAGRPGAGARRMARGLLPLLLPPLLRELGEWTVTLRACAARQLHTVLVLSEAGVTPQLPRLLPALCSAIGDENPDVAGNIIASVHVVGSHVPVTRWLPLMLDNVSNARLSLVQKANALVVLSGLLHAAAKVQAQQAASVPPAVLGALTSALTSDDMRASEHPAIRHQLLAVCTNMVRWLGPRSSDVVQQLYTLLLQLYGFERDAARLELIRGAMAELARACGRPDFEELAEAHGPAVLEAACAQADQWSAEAPGYLVFRALLLTAGPSTLSRLVPRLCAALGPILADVDGDAALRLGALQLLDALMEDQHRGNSLGGDAAHAVLSQLLLPPLVWRAGKTAAAIRFASVTALATMLKRQLVPEDTMLELVAGATLLPLLNQSLDEDWYTDLRNTACFVLEQLLLLTGPRLSHEARRLIYPELLKRLDDSSNQVRIAACRALLAFCATMPPTYCSTNSGYLAAGVIIHMDDSNTEVQEAACHVLEALAAVKPDVVAAEVAKDALGLQNAKSCSSLRVDDGTPSPS